MGPPLGAPLFAETALLRMGDPDDQLPRQTQDRATDAQGWPQGRSRGWPRGRPQARYGRLAAAMLIPVTRSISIDDSELTEDFLRASGAGGQNIQKVETAVQLRFNVRASPNLPGNVRARLERLAGRRMTKDGVLVISAQRHRTRERNRADALDRLLALIREAALPPPPPRRPTKPTRGSMERRLEDKSRRAGVKAGRGRPTEA